jgi:hypothetical protein
LERRPVCAEKNPGKQAAFAVFQGSDLSWAGCAAEYPQGESNPCPLAENHPTAVVSGKPINTSDANSAGCTAGCTTSGEQPSNPGSLDALAAVLLGLSAADRARLASLLIGGTDSGKGDAS